MALKGAIDQDINHRIQASLEKLQERVRSVVLEGKLVFECEERKKYIQEDGDKSQDARGLIFIII